MKIPLITTLAVLLLLLGWMGYSQINRNPDMGAKLNPPRNLTVVASAGSAKLAWGGTDSIDVADYSIYQSLDPKKNFRKIATVSETRYQVKDLLPNQTYYFQITASLNQVAESVPSNTVSIRLEK